MHAIFTFRSLMQMGAKLGVKSKLCGNILHAVAKTGNVSIAEIILSHLQVNLVMFECLKNNISFGVFY